MNITDTSRLLDEISQECVPQDVNLLSGVLSEYKKEKGNAMKLKYKIIVSALLVMVVVVTVIFTLPEGVSAIRKMLGFIPGIGIVDQTLPLRVLANPVTDSRDGYTITVENAVLDSEHTVITYTVDGPFGAGTAQPAGKISDVCFDAAELRLPNGAIYRVTEDFPDDTWKSGYRAQNSYGAIPADIDQATLFLPCLHARLIGQQPDNWEVPLSFVPAPPDFTVYPITRLTETPAESAPGRTTTNSPQGVDLKLDGVIPLQDGQLIRLRVDWRENPNISWVTIYPEDVKIYNALGQEFSFEPSSEAIDPNESDNQSTLYGYKTAAIEIPGPAQIVVNAASEVTYSSSATFTFDPGPNRQPNEVWELNQQLKIDGHILRILSVEVADTGGNSSLSVSMESADGIFGATVSDTDHPAVSGFDMAGSGGDDPIQTFSSGVNYDGGLPDGPITLTVMSYRVRVNGPWIMEWKPGSTPSTGITPSTQPQAPCISESDWTSALANPQSIPAELNRKMIYMDYNAKTSIPFLSIARLDGSEIHPLIENGQSASVSPDGTRVVYMGSDGVSVFNFTTGLSELIPGSSPNADISSAAWSPDGQHIGFTDTFDGRSPKNIFLANPDGSSPKLLTSEEPLKLMRGWMPDGHILYVTLGKKGPVLKLIDPQNGETSSLFNVPELALTGAFSKDGKRLALDWLDQTTSRQTLYVLTMDGSQRKPLLELTGDGFIRNMLWTPDGNWLLVDMSRNVPKEPYSKALVQVDTCKIIPVLNLEGTVLDWLP